ncbi:MAG: LysM peptidoglycan-binding domain-containing protein [Candidatus Omnitrophica bacterium]|nr:LysM peptidoglycan-binding domain-containing protein [Candidatus Omnitrophota bacterium]MCM8824494.1 LysM peptidoglycan-binding domain-containing protein [Candidatus Omnitrophota bacterium]MCM8826228.1 LysM peptidoglycan-binding domain-containing protein [Candidatus Omnitrophota bacterium]
MRSFLIILGVIFFSGCLIRIYNTEKPRKDIAMEGNQGYVVGESDSHKPKLKNTRTITVVEVELGSHRPKEVDTSKTIKEEELEIPKEETIYSSPIEEEISVKELQDSNINLETPKMNYTYYTVAEGDTLQKISSKFYGTTKKWYLLYEENKDVLKGPDKVYPGQKIKIPNL